MRILKITLAVGLLCALGGLVVAEPPVVSDQKKQHLLSLREDQARAVIALNEAIATAQAMARARHYRGEGAQLPHGDQIARLEKELDDFEQRFTIGYQAHFGAWQGGGGESPVRKERLALRPQAEKLIADPDGRARHREQLIADAKMLRDSAERLVRTLHDELAALRQRAGLKFDPAPAFEKKPAASIAADGTTNGILFGNAGGGTYYANRSNPAIAAIGFDYEVGGYDRYSNDPTFLAQLADSGAVGLKSTLIIPCAVHRCMASPINLWKKWLEEPAKDASLPVYALSGVRKGYQGHGVFELDFHHPAVRDMMTDYLTDAGERYKENPNVLWHVTTWEPHLSDTDVETPWGQWPIDSATPAGLLDFRRYLREKYSTIDALNAAWKSTYAAFEEIQFPPDVSNGPEPARNQLLRQLFIGHCPPLYYEFNRWVKDSYADWLAMCYQKLKAADSAHPIALSPSYGPYDGYLSTGRDTFLWAEKACDILGTELGGTREEVYMYSVKRLTGRATCNNEYIWNEPESVMDVPEHIVRAVGSRNLWRPVAWGRSAITIYGPSDTYGGGQYNNFMVHPVNYEIMRRCGGIIETTIRRLRSMEDIWLDAPIVEPKIAMLKPSASMICQPTWQLTESVMQNLHENLHDRNYQYAYVPEEYLLDGRDRLDNYNVLILPLASHFPPGLNEKILPWVQSGGTLIISGIAGGWTPHGQRDGKLLQEIFGIVEYQVWYDEAVGNDWTWMMNTSSLRDGVRQLDERTFGQRMLATYGKGKVLLAAKLNDLGPAGPATPAMYELLDEAAPRLAWVEGAPFEMILRQKGERLYMTLINPDPNRAYAARVRLADRFTTATDRGIERGFPVPLREEGTFFDIHLSPGEGTVVALDRPK